MISLMTSVLSSKKASRSYFMTCLAFHGKLATWLPMTSLSYSMPSVFSSSSVSFLYPLSLKVTITTSCPSLRRALVRREKRGGAAVMVPSMSWG